MSTTTKRTGASAGSSLLRRHIALPQDHGSWVFLLSPLLIGLFAGGAITSASLILSVAALAAFLARQPATIFVKARSGRRSRADIHSALFWLGVYGLIVVAGLVVLVWQGYAPVLLLAIPALAIFAWHLSLVSRRNERRQAGVEIIASGSLALAAPAAYWVGLGSYDPLGWVMWALTWLQAAASIVYAYLRLAQRELQAPPEPRKLWAIGRRAMLYTSFNLGLTLALAWIGLLPRFIWLPFLLQWAESMWGIAHPAIGWKPTKIGVRQLAVSTLFTLLFILTWRP